MNNKLVSMKLSKEEMKDTLEAQPISSKDNKGPRYPYGLEISLEKESLEKLGIDLDEYDVGDGLYLEALCKITSKSESKSDSSYGGKDEQQSLRIQLCDMAIEKHSGKEESEDDLSWDDDEQTASKKLKKKGYR